MENTKEDRILLALIEDRMEQCSDHYTITASPFLDLHQRGMAEGLCRRSRGIQYAFYGGYENAERCIAVFFPDYIEKRNQPELHFMEQKEDDPLAVIRATAAPGSKPLTHRDYLGSLTGLGLKREMMGDILVRIDGADMIVLREIADFLLMNYEKAGSVNLKLELVPIGELIVPEDRTEEKNDTVASLRLDNLIASVFSLSRGKAAETIRGGAVFQNNRQVCKPDAPVQEGDKLVLRGQGKAVLKKVGGQTRKDRVYITFERFL